MLTLPQAEASLWREASLGHIYPSLDKDITVNVVVIGAGITGLTTAYLLKQAGLTVAVLDKYTVGGGTTGRTTGKVTAQHSLSYVQLQKSIGMHHTQAYAEANHAAIDQIEQIITDENIECDWERQDNYIFTDNPSRIEELQSETAVSKELGLPAEFVTETPLPFPVAGAVKFTNQAKMTAQKYVAGLADVVNGQGSYVFENSNANWIRDGAPCTVRTDIGSVTAEHCVVATNVPTMPLMARGGYCILEYPTESYIIAAPYDKKLDGMYISPDKKHFSILPATFGGTDYLLIGGGGHLSGVRISKKLRYQRLAKYAQQYFGITHITHKWSDRDYLAYDKVPLVGKLYPWSQHMYVGTAFKKWGLTNGTVAGMILSDLITGKESKWADTFSPQRLRPLKYIPRSVYEQAKQIW